MLTESPSQITINSTSILLKLEGCLFVMDKKNEENENKERKELLNDILAEIDKEAIFRYLVLDAIQQRADFLKGVAIGLFFGIVGNMFVQHWYPVFEG